MKNRSAAAVLVLALGLALGLLLLGSAPPAANDDPSSRVAGKAGTLALYDWLAGLGFDTHRVAGTFTLAGTDVLIVSQPTATFTEADAATTIQFLDGGGDVILAVDAASTPLAQPILSALQVSLDILRPAGSSVPAQPFDAAARVRSVPMGDGVGIDPAPFLTPLLVQGTVATAVGETVGQGRAYVLASPFPLSNDGLRDGDSAMLVLSLLERARGGHIAFDEYHHGEQSSLPSGAAAIFQSPLGLALLLATAAVVLGLGVSGRRLGPAVADAGSLATPTTASYIEAMASLLARTRDRRAVATRYAEELRGRLAPDLGLPVSVAGEELAAAVAERRPELAAQVRDCLALAHRLGTSRPSAAQLLSLALEVDALERAWAEPVRAAAGPPQ
ncbi:MAG: DUF4350 domain-containing protein [Candidatus Dormibacteria bacterium]